MEKAEIRPNETPLHDARFVGMLERILGAGLKSGISDANEGVLATPFESPSGHWDRHFNDLVDNGYFDGVDEQSVVYLADLDPTGHLAGQSIQSGDILIAVRSTYFSTRSSDWATLPTKTFDDLGRALGTFVDRASQKGHREIDLEFLFARDGINDNRRIAVLTVPLQQVKGVAMSAASEIAPLKASVVRHNFLPPRSVGHRVAINYPKNRDTIILRAFIEHNFAAIFFEDRERREELFRLAAVYFPVLVQTYDKVCRSQLGDRGRWFEYTVRRFDRRVMNPGGSYTNYYIEEPGEPVYVHKDLYDYFAERFHGQPFETLIAGVKQHLASPDTDGVGYAFATFEQAGELSVGLQSILQKANCGEVGEALLQGMRYFVQRRLWEPYTDGFPYEKRIRNDRVSYTIAMLGSGDHFVPETDWDTEFFSFEYIYHGQPSDALQSMQVSSSFYTGLDAWRRTLERSRELRRAATEINRKNYRGIRCGYFGRPYKIFLVDDPRQLSDETRETLAELGVTERRTSCPLDWRVAAE
ncbi:MAG: hypothetical protein QNJ14_17125 [Woeseiaceae bacterium]|nr:hypothetical protein [Woeseiaceae bacterium]